MLMLAGLCAVTYFSGSSILRALLMAGLGLALGCIGPDPMTAEPRLSFGLVSLAGGVDIVALAIGLFGISELLFMARRQAEDLRVIAPPSGLLGFLPNREEARRSVGPTVRGSVLGFLVGVLPGGGAVFASFLSYAMERKLSKRPEEFGSGAVEGLAGPESANNAGTAGAFVPLLCMGLPANAITAVLLSAFMVHGVAPGPAMIERQPELFWGIIASMYLGNIMLLVLNLPLIGLLVRVLEIPRAWLSPLILLLCLVGVYSSAGDASDVVMCVAFGFLGYFLRRHGYDLGIVILAFVLGPIIERSVRQALTISNGDPAIFVQSPLAIGLAVLVIAILVAGLWPKRPVIAPV
jgi:putative tricarboxylic transport membrane protein